MERLLQRLRDEAERGNALAGEAAKALDTFAMDRREQEEELMRLASRNAALVIENDSLKSALDYRARG